MKNKIKSDKQKIDDDNRNRSDKLQINIKRWNKVCAKDRIPCSYSDMKLTTLCILAVAYLAVPSFSEPFIIELPGYAKAVMGAYGKNRSRLTCKSAKVIWAIISGNLSTSWYNPRRPFYSFRYFHYAAKPTYETRFLVISQNLYISNSNTELRDRLVIIGFSLFDEINSLQFHPTIHIQMMKSTIRSICRLAVPKEVIMGWKTVSFSVFTRLM